MSELTKQFDGLEVVSSGGFVGGEKSAYVYERVPVTDSRSPSFALFDLGTECHALILSALFAFLVIATVSQILAYCARPEIFIAIIQSITVSVIYMGAVPSDYLSVHPYDILPCGLRVVPFASLVKVSGPVESRQSVVAVSRYYRDLASCQSYEPARLPIDVNYFCADFGSYLVESAGSTVLAAFGLYIFLAGRTKFVLVRSLLGWCKIVSRLGDSFRRRVHVLTSNESMRTGPHFCLLYQQLRTV